MQDAAALLIVGVVFDFLGGDRPSALSHVAEFEFPHRQHSQPVVAEDPDIKLAPLDILFGDSGSADPLMNEADALCELVVGVDDGGLRDTIGSVLAQTLDDQGQGKPSRTPDLS